MLIEHSFRTIELILHQTNTINYKWSLYAFPESHYIILPVTSLLLQSFKVLSQEADPFCSEESAWFFLSLYDRYALVNILGASGGVVLFGRQVVEIPWPPISVGNHYITFEFATGQYPSITTATPLPMHLQYLQVSARPLRERHRFI